MTQASRVVLSYPEELSEWGRDQVTADRYVNYLRKVIGETAVGEEFEEFVDCGCGRTTDVTLRIEAVEGGNRLGPGAALDLVHRSEV